MFTFQALPPAADQNGELENDRHHHHAYDEEEEDRDKLLGMSKISLKQPACKSFNHAECCVHFENTCMY